MANHHNDSEHHHCGDDHDHAHGHSIVSNMKVAFVINLLFTIIEFVGGILTNSMAILSDAVHDLGDTVAIGSAVFFEKYAQKGRDKRYSYGYKRFSPFAALINVVILISGSIVIIIESIPRLLRPEAVNAQGMLWLAILGIIMNGLAVLRLRKGNQNSANQRVLMLHLLEDVLGWVAVLIGSIIMLLVDLPIIDPILSIVIGLYIGYNAVKNLKGLGDIFLQAIPSTHTMEQIVKALSAIAQVQDVHDEHLWTMDGKNHVFSAHLTIDDNISKENFIKTKEAAASIVQSFHIQHYTFELEFECEECKFTDC